VATTGGGISPLRTDTVLQQQVATSLGDISAHQFANINAFLEHVHSLQPHLQGDTALATQAQATRLNEAGIALMKELASIAERVGHAADSYLTSDHSGHGIVMSAGNAF
jgi:uncharacterized protein YukE